MPTASVGDIAMHYETEGSGDPLILIPYLSADHACYAFQTPEYSKHYTCVAVVVKGWQTMAQALGSVADMVIQGIFPWCFTHCRGAR
jgi:hypothetical protein